MKQNGFTLIEFTIFLALLALIVSITIPSLSFLNRQIVASDLERMQMTFNYMQQNAISSNKNLTLKFNKNNNAFTYENKIENLSKNTKFAVKHNSTQEQKISSPITFVNDQVIFYSNGQIQPGALYLTDAQQQFVYALTVPISQISFIRKYKFQNGKWILI